MVLSNHIVGHQFMRYSAFGTRGMNLHIRCEVILRLPGHHLMVVVDFLLYLIITLWILTMDFYQLEYKVQSWAYSSVQTLSIWSYDAFILSLSLVISLTILVGLSPLLSTGNTTTFEMVCIFFRKALILAFILIMGVVFLAWLLVFVANSERGLFDAFVVSIDYYWSLMKTQAPANSHAPHRSPSRRPLEIFNKPEIVLKISKNSQPSYH